ncbi:bifunctional serine/threonine-protein kinase/ABC transporter substrate-binding protein [Streptomyces sp. NBC_01803]|uniref:bifunctional serine/threonine-protein kinase/ABC transporter substrate-binding protein n=1 Tax=Streptomyces sp. NBC_01803 TaxID=2975946 RepID=UPI002DD906DA|nr:bifunctional serine/threonine-protein kinase/ABC transporter substrate-binding protein [Streptomyces sp. NBC_01803]WSA43276.1 bifunctional serine/threonine-protein kinase/ABC transporter substrate-binding protein [Streptomyces sp. NBC_01803]
MRDLEPTDPRRIGGYRLLRRLAEGRTGIVYLARSLAGTPIALKVIRPRYARDPDHRARFERDVAAARHVSARCLVTILAADTAGGTTWAAFPYVPGPSLTEAVGTHGPLPPWSARALGSLLAGALWAIHDAGLTHRDVRPGHVLLTPDGPRLTGFGGTGGGAGTPGYLSPEQARGTEPGPAGDVFSLGCLLAHAVTGRPPFGAGTDAELVLRARDESPDLADVPRSLLEIVQACLHKEPVLRPTVAELRAELGIGGGGADWLPSAVAREVAERFAAPPPPLAPEPEPEPKTDPSADSGRSDSSDRRRPRTPERPAPPPEPPPGRTRRRAVLLLGGGAGLTAAVGGLAAAWLRPGSGPAASAGSGPRHTIGLHADLTGERRAFGLGQRCGLIMAVEELNGLGDLPFELEYRAVDDGGDPERAAEAARELAADRSVLAVIGPTGDPVARSAAEAYAAAGVPLLALSVGAFEPRDGLTTLLHARPDTGSACRAIPAYLADELAARRVGLVHDRGAGAYSSRTTGAVTAAADRDRIELVPRVLAADGGSFASLAAEFTAAEVDAVVYGGRAEGAGRLARALSEAGYTGVGLATEEALGPGFYAAAGDAAQGWRFVAGYTDSGADFLAQGFAAAHRSRFGGKADPYAAESYDAAVLLATEMRRAAREGTPLSRTVLLPRLREARHRGVARELAFDAAGDYAGAGPTAYLYEAKAGSFQFRGPVPAPAGTVR